MKKHIFKILFVCLCVFGVSFILNANTKTIEVTRSSKGDTMTIRETDRCGGGYMMRCTGNGNLCSRTIGFDCVQMQ